MNVNTGFELTMESSVGELQEAGERIYGIVNGQNFEKWDMVGRLLRYLARVLQMVEDSDTKRSKYHLCMMLSWVFALANELKLNRPGNSLEFAWKQTYPNLGEVHPTLHKFQELVTRNSEGISLETHTLHLAKAVAKIGASLEYFNGTHREEHARTLIKSLVETAEALCSIASFLDFDLQSEFLEIFRNGCPTCRETPCRKCGFNPSEVM